jgi:hypothetical protein
MPVDTTAVATVAALNAAITTADGLAANSRTFTSNELVLTNTLGAHATLAITGSFVTGQFNVVPDGNVGTDVTMVPPPLTYGQTIDVAGTVAARRLPARPLG